jgi:hypothetical protein
MLKYEVPQVYDLIQSLTPIKKRKAPPVEIIRTVCAASPDPSLRKPKFHRWLEQYERSGVCCRRPKLPTPERMAFYYNLRRRKLECSMNENGDEMYLPDSCGGDINSTQ